MSISVLKGEQKINEKSQKKIFCLIKPSPPHPPPPPASPFTLSIWPGSGMALYFPEAVNPYGKLGFPEACFEETLLSG